MPKRSAGLLMYRRVAGELEVFLVHPGGPIWAKKDKGAWTIPKGEYEREESPLVAARREFEEETGFQAGGEFVELGTVKQKSGKLVTAWAFEGDCDPAKLKSNTCQIEWPPRSGRRLEIPEVDRGRWFPIEEAGQYIREEQRSLLDTLRNRFSMGTSHKAIPVQSSLWEQQAGELLGRISSTEPTPGGGSVAMMTACMGIALLRKAVAVSLKKERGDGDRSHQLEAMLAELSRESAILEGSADGDSALFNAYIRAVRLPRGSAAEAKIREQAVEEALAGATSAPLAAAVTIRGIVSLALRGLALIHDVILSDAIAGVHLLQASAVCLLLTAESNLPGLAKSSACPALKKQLKELQRTVAKMKVDLERALRDR
ncbi:MAG TPA: cyclodeaminase/cyclohydrolase family protein [Acidobacteriaceae bacterium]